MILFALRIADQMHNASMKMPLLTEAIIDIMLILVGSIYLAILIKKRKKALSAYTDRNVKPSLALCAVDTVASSFILLATWGNLLAGLFLVIKANMMLATEENGLAMSLNPEVLIWPIVFLQIKILIISLLFILIFWAIAFYARRHNVYGRKM